MEKITPPDGTRHKVGGDQDARNQHGSALNRAVASHNVPPDGAYCIREAHRLGTDVWGVPASGGTPWSMETVETLDVLPLEPELHKTFSRLHRMIDSGESEELPAFEALLNSNQDFSLYTMTENQVQIRGRGYYNEPLLFRSIRQNKYRYAISLYKHCPDPLRQPMLNACALGGFYFLNVLFWTAKTKDHYSQIIDILNTIDVIPENALASTMESNCFLHFMDYRFKSCGEIFNIIYHKSSNHESLDRLSIQRNHERKTPLFNAFKRGNEPIIIIFLYHLIRTAAIKEPSASLIEAMEQTKSHRSLDPIMQNEAMKKELDHLLADFAETPHEKALFQMDLLSEYIDDESIAETSDVMVLPEGLQFLQIIP
ncbi:hypothetical protein ElyMa_003262000 [Elysia marginata]|uniref:ELYS-like domain-containing protein n=1 Tax=Elysia marginata TaxID=1093978 RepID=A0AAV4JAH6_9GAST|nr:hypothetical protein ElyMa_003262000 [Elysia marginata]